MNPDTRIFDFDLDNLFYPFLSQLSSGTVITEVLLHAGTRVIFVATTSIRMLMMRPLLVF